MSTEGRKVGYREITEKQTELILLVNYGLNYARKILNDKYSNKTEATYNRELNRLNEINWLIKKDMRVKNKKEYSVNWNKITDSFVIHLTDRLRTKLSEWNVWSKQDFKVDVDFNADTLTKLSKSDNEKIKDKELVKDISKIISNLRKAKREDKEKLIPYFQNDALVILHELNFSGNLTSLYDEVIYGIGKSMKEGLLGNKIKFNPFMNEIIYSCYIIYYIDKERYYNPLSHSFKSFISKK